ncbi:hypothetical protein C0Q70_05917 [Pomacea canaliculata]|uniref:Macroglobulin domain-containing protein n=1 Tax=Pomacea canaliculata TaxID=400727 RepID=A0A2T7PMI8_POMCA|nr:hypothetical protein C0Q70_05917 [Pomacea canaliculata]
MVVTAKFNAAVLEPHFSSSTMTCVPVFVLFLVTTTGFASPQNRQSTSHQYDIMMRILAMNPDLSVLKAPMDVFIKDPKDNLVRQWKQVKEDRTGVVELSMPTSTYPILGNWTIQARILDLNETQIFTIDKYVLPKFEASVHVPKKVLITNEIKGTASAKYTFGKPLTEADVSVVVRLQTTTSAPNISSTGKLDSKGEFAFSFTNAQLLALSSQTFNWQSLESKEAEAQMKDYTAIKSVDKAYSPSGNFLKVVMDSPEPEDAMAPNAGVF